MAGTLFSCKICHTFQTRSKPGMENHYSQTSCGQQLDKRLVRAAKMAKRKRAISPPPTDDTPSNLPASLSFNLESVPDPGEWHPDPDPDFAATEPPPSKKTRVEDVEDEDDAPGPLGILY
ncbi:hypothetical protein EV421DRAFT_1911579 [Armillaria borealis]|uniref:Uncharacterized protein n=1 Tax=Armillaria borealis TaxID=47425 RepID=A0AA39IWC4_9AGAR|nr:hypothetical protein EV421DRAFT_1911579 [Armillaria borealis]